MQNDTNLRLSYKRQCMHAEIQARPFPLNCYAHTVPTPLTPSEYNLPCPVNLFSLKFFPQSRMITSTHGSLHSLLPSRLRSHSTPMPVHSVRIASRRFASSSAVPASAAAVLFTAPRYIDSCSAAGFCSEKLLSSAARVVDCLGSNQLLLKSKKQWSDQWHDEANSMRSRNEQYTHGLFRKYVQTKKRKMNIGEALVGMKRRGSQL